MEIITVYVQEINVIRLLVVGLVRDLVYHRSRGYGKMRVTVAQTRRSTVTQTRSGASMTEGLSTLSSFESEASLE